MIVVWKEKWTMRKDIRLKAARVYPRLNGK